MPRRGMTSSPRPSRRGGCRGNDDERCLPAPRRARPAAGEGSSPRPTPVARGLGQRGGPSVSRTPGHRVEGGAGFRKKSVRFAQTLGISHALGAFLPKRYWEVHGGRGRGTRPTLGRGTRPILGRDTGPGAAEGLRCGGPGWSGPWGAGLGPQTHPALALALNPSQAGGRLVGTVRTQGVESGLWVRRPGRAWGWGVSLEQGCRGGGWRGTARQTGEARAGEGQP